MNPTILIVDDDTSNLASLVKIFGLMLAYCQQRAVKGARDRKEQIGKYHPDRLDDAKYERR